MGLNRLLINEPPLWNDAATRWLADFPVYLRHDYLVPHNHKLHMQRGIELNLTLEGQATYVIDKQIWRQSPGQLLVIPGQMPHQVYIDRSQQYTRMVVLIDDRRLASVLPGEWSTFDSTRTACHQIKLRPDTYLALKDLLFGMLRERSERKTGWQQMIAAGLMSLAVIVQRCIEDEAARNEDVSPVTRRMYGDDPIERLCTYINAHLHDDLTLKKMASMFHISPDHLIRVFKREKGMTYHKYVLLQRIFESKRLLVQHPEMTLTDIAYQVGFASSSQFSKTFKQINAMTPSEFRSEAASFSPFYDDGSRDE